MSILSIHSKHEYFINFNHTHSIASILNWSKINYQCKLGAPVIEMQSSCLHCKWVILRLRQQASVEFLQGYKNKYFVSALIPFKFNVNIYPKKVILVVNQKLLNCQLCIE